MKTHKIVKQYPLTHTITVQVDGKSVFTGTLGEFKKVKGAKHADFDVTETSSKTLVLILHKFDRFRWYKNRDTNRYTNGEMLSQAQKARDELAKLEASI
jgi:hypothetical protein